MYEIPQIPAVPYQTQTLVLPDGSKVQLTLYFMPMQQAWMIQEISYQDFVLQNVQITVNTNILRQWRNLIPFGLACFSNANREPSLLEDFATKNAQLFILTSAEVQQYEDSLSGS